MPKKIINEQGITLFWKPTCPYSRAAFTELKKFADENKVTIQVWDMNENPELYEKLKHTTNHMTVPQIFFGNKFIGGYDALMVKLARK